MWGYPEGEGTGTLGDMWGTGGLGGQLGYGDARDMGTRGFGTCVGTRWAQGHRGHPGHRGHGHIHNHRGTHRDTGDTQGSDIHDHAGMRGDTLGMRTPGTHQARGHSEHRGAAGTGTLGHRGHSQVQATQGCAGTRQVSPACPRAGVGAHRVSSGSDSGSRVLGFCSIHRNSIKERSAPTEGAPAPRGGHAGAATARGPRRGATPRTPWCPSVLSTAQHPGPDPAGQRCQRRAPPGEKGTGRGRHRGEPQGGVWSHGVPPRAVASGEGWV